MVLGKLGMRPADRSKVSVFKANAPYPCAEFGQYWRLISYPLVSGATVNDCDATIYASITNDNPAGSPVYGPWTPFFVADLTCRAAKFKLDLSSGIPTNNIDVSTLTVHVKEAA